ncbi:protein phosphatase 1 regulatory subunit 12B [Pimephales promelas]|nr:protein phosphatase 1 regulatory subunit 12B [Pimephales promelas]
MQAAAVVMTTAHSARLLWKPAHPAYSYFFRESEWTDENDNILYGSYDASLTQQLTEDCDLRTDLIGLLTEQDRASRSDSSGVESPSDRLSARTGTYTRRENRLASLSKTDDNSASKDYKKLYEDALAENEKLKSRLDDSKLELTKIRSQLDRVAQKQDRISERSTVFESEKREKEALEKKVSDMEEELKFSVGLNALEKLNWSGPRAVSRETTFGNGVKPQGLSTCWFGKFLRLTTNASRRSLISTLRCGPSTEGAEAPIVSVPVPIIRGQAPKTLPALARLQALRRGNAHLLVENKAMLRTLARLSQTASLPETEDL